MMDQFITKTSMKQVFQMVLLVAHLKEKNNGLSNKERMSSLCNYAVNIISSNIINQYKKSMFEDHSKIGLDNTSNMVCLLDKTFLGK
jgi:hypothetical protein